MRLPQDFYERLPRYYLFGGLLCLLVGMGQPTLLLSGALLLISSMWVTGMRKKARAARMRVARRKAKVQTDGLRSLDDLSSLY